MPLNRSMNRRAFLRLSASAVAVAPMLGCSEEEPAGSDGTPLPEPVDATVTKGPWVTILAPGTVRLRFETHEDVAVPVVVHVDGARTDLVTATSTATVAWAWGWDEGPTTPDIAGDYTVHDVVVEGIPAGATLAWEVRANGLPAGSARPNPAPTDPITVAWIADTMFPVSEVTTAMAAAMAPDLVLHGGDLQYRSNPADTWTALFGFMEPLLRSAPFQVCIGNHEFDAPEEAAELYDRLFAGQGDSDERWHAVTFGPLHVLMLDSESGDLADMDGAQVAWADAELAWAVSEGRIPVIAFHRPTYSLSKHWRSDTSLRDAVHTLATRHGVQLVLAGHVHGYERFVVDGIHYVVDGGGGALTYDLEEGRAEVEAARPSESDLRVVAERTYGCTEIVVEDGTVSVTRLNEDGGTTDSFSFVA
jgi:predicted phosphodiesterase